MGEHIHSGVLLDKVIEIEVKEDKSISNNCWLFCFCLGSLRSPESAKPMHC